MTKIGLVRSSTVARLGRWDPGFVLRLKAEVEARGASIDDDIEETQQAQDDLQFIEKNQQKQRVLPLPGKPRP